VKTTIAVLGLALLVSTGGFSVTAVAQSLGNTGCTGAECSSAGANSASSSLGISNSLSGAQAGAVAVSGQGGQGGQGSQGSSTTGVPVAGTVSGSPAANAGLTAGDTVTAIGGQSVSSA